MDRQLASRGGGETKLKLHQTEMSYLLHTENWTKLRAKSLLRVFPLGRLETDTAHACNWWRAVLTNCTSSFMERNVLPGYSTQGLKMLNTTSAVEPHPGPWEPPLPPSPSRLATWVQAPWSSASWSLSWWYPATQEAKDGFQASLGCWARPCLENSDKKPKRTINNGKK